MPTNTFTIEEIKQAFWQQFHKVGVVDFVNMFSKLASSRMASSEDSVVEKVCDVFTQREFDGFIDHLQANKFQQFINDNGLGPKDMERDI